MWRHGIRGWKSFTAIAALAVGVGMLAPVGALAQETAEAAPAAAAITQETIDNLTLTTNNVWMMLCAGLVFIMHLGFATLESGLCRAKNTVNILTKNVAIVAIGLLTYYVCGFGLMYPGFEDGSRSFLGFGGWGLELPENGLTAAYASAGYTYWTDFLFQAMFAATAATIVSGAVAERIKLMPFLLFSTLFVAICYPILGSWKWGYGWLNTVGFHDFAGSTLVHSVGGWGALAGVILLGPRIGKYTADGRAKPIFGHSMPLAVIGVLLLWLGWFGFNGGSVLSADPGGTSLVLVTTCLAAAAGAIAALFVSYFAMGNPDLSMCLNGILAGLVGITAGADVMTPMHAIIVGTVAGTIVVFSVIALDKLRLDDPVGAISVHLVCGIWGTLAVGIFGSKGLMGGEGGLAQLGYQAIGVAAYGVVTFVFAMVVFGVLKATTGIRVSAAEEVEGLDLGEHGMEAYPGFAKDAAADASVAPSATAATSPKRAVVTA
jgi:Amt family ammonium transporter